MAWALFLVTLLSYFSGVCSQQSLTQPATLSVQPGQTAKLPCTITGSVSYFQWVRQRPGQGPHNVIYGSTRGQGIPDRFTTSSSGSDRYLTITNVQAEDEADYYCAAWTSSGLHSAKFSWGTETKTFSCSPRTWETKITMKLCLFYAECHFN
ncbi:UNVERIFIED_CONTAM: hypothetical protein K2H54_021798 [Gekko kuhli]